MWKRFWLAASALTASNSMRASRSEAPRDAGTNAAHSSLAFFSAARSVLSFSTSICKAFSPAVGTPGRSCCTVRPGMPAPRRPVARTPDPVDDVPGSALPGTITDDDNVDEYEAPIGVERSAWLVRRSACIVAICSLSSPTSSSTLRRATCSAALAFFSAPRSALNRSFSSFIANIW